MDFLNWFSGLPSWLQWVFMVGTFLLAVLSFVQSKGWPIMSMVFTFSRSFIWPGRDAWVGHCRPIPAHASSEHRYSPYRDEERAFRGRGSGRVCRGSMRGSSSN